MRTLTLASRLKIWRLLFICFASLLAAVAVTVADAAPLAPASREFWVADHNVVPPTSRKTSAKLRAEGDRTLIYVEEKLWEKTVTASAVDQLRFQMETAMPSGAFIGNTGIVEFEERLFGSLPKTKSNESRLIVLFSDLGNLGDHDGYFNSSDLFSEKEAMEKFQQHSNELNIVYLNGARKTTASAAGVVAHELHHLLSAASPSKRENWLSETLAEGAMLLAGYFGDQSYVNRLAQSTGDYSLVSTGEVQFGPQLLFSSFLIDSLPHSHNTAIGYVSKLDLPGRDAIESLFRDITDAPPTFDAIFSNFVSYVFSQSESGTALPNTWRHNPSIVIPKLSPYFTYEAGSGELTGELAPYSFVAIDLAHSLSPSVVVQVQRVPDDNNVDTHACANAASVLWKPINPTRIAVYSVGCDPSQKNEKVHFRLKIFDEPSLQPPSPFKLFR